MEWCTVRKSTQVPELPCLDEHALRGVNTLGGVITMAGTLAYYHLAVKKI